jgi:hypothetical protein
VAEMISAYNLLLQDRDRLRDALKRLQDWTLTQQGDFMCPADHPIAQAAAALSSSWGWSRSDALLDAAKTPGTPGVRACARCGGKADVAWCCETEVCPEKAASGVPPSQAPSAREDAKKARPPSDEEPWVVADDEGVRVTFSNEDAAWRYRNEYTNRLVNPTVTHEPATSGVPGTPAPEIQAWLWQRDETGHTGFVDAWQVENRWQEANPGCKLIRALVFAPDGVDVPGEGKA